MIIVILRNPEPDNPMRKGTDIEVRMMIEGATEEEGDIIGTALHDAAKKIRPALDPTAFIYKSDAVLS